MIKIAEASEIAGLNPNSTSNFQYIYGDAAYKQEFYNFLVNVFHLFPEDKMHALIEVLTKQNPTDKAIYTKGQDALPKIKPMFADLSYSLPALSKQKDVITAQTQSLLGRKKNFSGYLEIGSNGRYLDSLEEKLKIKGERYFLSEFKSSYSPVDIVDRGQIIKAGKDIDLKDYKSSLDKKIPKGSIDLATVYIGFHHCPVPLREGFITSIRDTMSDDGVLILRDHNVHNKKMLHMVALAHDVFNMGTNMTWTYNEKELRNFYSLEDLDQMMVKFGFKSDGRKLYQSGDPTLNALMKYTKA